MLPKSWSGHGRCKGRGKSLYRSGRGEPRQTRSKQKQSLQTSLRLPRGGLETMFLTIKFYSGDSNEICLKLRRPTLCVISGADGTLRYHGLSSRLRIVIWIHTSFCYSLFLCHLILFSTAQFLRRTHQIYDKQALTSSKNLKMCDSWLQEWGVTLRNPIARMTSGYQQIGKLWFWLLEGTVGNIFRLATAYSRKTDVRSLIAGLATTTANIA